MPSERAHGSLGDFWLHTHTLDSRGELAADEVGAGEVNKQGGSSIGLTWDRSVSVVRPEQCPAMVGGEAAATPPLRFGFRRNVGWS
jgi:hypothetical protein